MIDLDNPAQLAEFENDMKPIQRTFYPQDNIPKGWTCVKCFQFFKEWTRFQYHKCASDPDTLPGTHRGTREFFE